jgi:hypothetical protein
MRVPFIWSTGGAVRRLRLVNRALDEKQHPSADTASAMSEEGNVKFVLDGYARFNAG